jgi:hypothetical protein
MTVRRALAATALAALALGFAGVAHTPAGVARAFAADASPLRVAAETPDAGHSWLETTHITPPPQPPLAILGDSGYAAVRAAFRGGDGTTRLLLMMSPT